MESSDIKPDKTLCRICGHHIRIPHLNGMCRECSDAQKPIRYNQQDGLDERAGKSGIREM